MAIQKVQRFLATIWVLVYKGGFIVPLLMAVNLILLTFVVERYIMLWRAKGRGNLNSFVRRLRDLLNEDKIEEAIKFVTSKEVHWQML